MGGLAVGLLALGGFGTGFLAFGGMSLGIAAIGGGAVGYVAFGGGAIGWLGAAGGAALAHHFAFGGTALAAHANDQAAQAFMHGSAFFRHVGSLFITMVVICWLPMVVMVYLKRRLEREYRTAKPSQKLF
jgi:hypothetical protein